MESLLEEHQKLSKMGTLTKSLDDVQKTIDLLVRARNSIAEAPVNTPKVLTKLQNPVKQSFEAVNTDLKDVHRGLGNYAKALDKKFKDKTLYSTEYDALSSQRDLINRAVGMHLLREGQFPVASAFMAEAAPNISPAEPGNHMAESAKPDALQKQFVDMYYILEEMKTRKNLMPAINWTREHSEVLEARDSNLEFELARLQFVWLFTGGFAESHDLPGRQRSAMSYARHEFRNLQGRYLREVQQLICAMAFSSNLQASPYRHIFHDEGAWDDVAMSFTREFCSLLGLSADSPLYIATTAGAVALPMLQKLQSIMKEKRTEWTTQHELPVEIPLPPAYQFHSIFVCPVSKEQTTDENPPMMMPCGHVIAEESLNRLSKVNKFKCPYCPGESHPREAKKVFL